jgi:hypothetical protein
VATGRRHCERRRQQRRLSYSQRRSSRDWFLTLVCRLNKNSMKRSRILLQALSSGKQSAYGFYSKRLQWINKYSATNCARASGDHPVGGTRRTSYGGRYAALACGKSTGSNTERVSRGLDQSHPVSARHRPARLDSTENAGGSPAERRPPYIARAASVLSETESQRRAHQRPAAQSAAGVNPPTYYYLRKKARRVTASFCYSVCTRFRTHRLRWGGGLRPTNRSL